MAKRGTIVHVGVDGNVEKALRKFKKKVAESRKLLDLREREHYVKPTTARKIKKNAAQGRWKKYLASQQLPKQNF
jgi:small subunit ribosomal protein S21